MPSDFAARPSLPAAPPQEWQLLMLGDLEKIRAHLLDCIASFSKTKSLAARALHLIVTDRLILSADNWAILVLLCSDMATQRIACAAQSAELATLSIEKGDCSGAFTAYRQCIFEAGEANGIIESMRAKSSAGAHAKHADDASEEAEARAYWKRHIKPMRRKITREKAAQILIKIVPIQLSTAKTYMRKWEKEEETAKSNRAARAKLKHAFPSLFPSPRLKPQT